MIKVMAVIAGIAVVLIAALLIFAASKPDTFRSSPTSSAGSSPDRIASMRGPTPYVAKIVHVLFDMDKMVGSDFEVVAPERVVIVCTAEDDKGVPRLDEVIQVTFTEQGGKTKLSLNAVASGPSPEAGVMLDGMQKGWAQTVDRLNAHLHTKP